LEDTVKQDVEWLRAHPLMKEVSLVCGAVYDLETGRLEKIEVN
jgi:carbonic anhydrase